MTTPPANPLTRSPTCPPTHPHTHSPMQVLSTTYNQLMAAKLGLKEYDRTLAQVRVCVGVCVC